MLLSVNDLSVSRGGRVLLQRVSFDLLAGQVFFLTGKNGIGKTSLLRSLSGLQPSDVGQVTAPQNNVVYAAHLDGIKPMLTVAENLAFWAAVFGTSNCEETLDQFELRPYRNAMAGALSAGQKRRLGLARLLVSKRNIWLLDEPTVSLDQASVIKFTSILNTHLDAGGGAVIATHAVLEMCKNQRTLDLNQFAAGPQKLSVNEEAFL